MQQLHSNLWNITGVNITTPHYLAVRVLNILMKALWPVSKILFASRTRALFVAPSFHRLAHVLRYPSLWDLLDGDLNFIMQNIRKKRWEKRKRLRSFRRPRPVSSEHAWPSVQGLCLMRDRTFHEVCIKLRVLFWVCDRFTFFFVSQEFDETKIGRYLM